MAAVNTGAASLSTSGGLVTRDVALELFPDLAGQDMTVQGTLTLASPTSGGELRFWWVPAEPLLRIEYFPPVEGLWYEGPQHRALTQALARPGSIDFTI